MPPKPTCKVVKRQGQTGARIDPKGCKVRSEKDAAGRVKTTNKQGQQKHKVKETDRDHYLFISGNKTTHHNKRNNWNNETPAQKAAFGSTHRILYHTGATGMGQDKRQCHGGCGFAEPLRYVRHQAAW